MGQSCNQGGICERFNVLSTFVTLYLTKMNFAIYHMWVMFLTSCISFGTIVILLRCSRARFVFSITSTRKCSAACWSASMAVGVYRRSILKSWEISLTSLVNGSFLSRSIVACVLWKYLICRSAKLLLFSVFAHWGFRVGRVALCRAAFHCLACSLETCLPETMLKLCKKYVLLFSGRFWPISKETYDFG